MRFRDFLITILISTITSLIIIWTLINAGIIPTQQQYPQLYIKQQHSGTLVGIYNETSKMYEAYIDNFPIEDVSLTEKGKKVAEHLDKIERILAEQTESS